MRKLFFILILSCCIHTTYGQSGQDTLATHLDFKEDLIDYPLKYTNERIPLLIPIKGKHSYKGLHINACGLKNALDIIVSVNVRLNHNLKDSIKTLHPISVYVTSISFPDGKVLLRAKDIESCYDMYIWSKVNETLINWMYQQPFDDYYIPEKSIALYPDTPITSLSFTYKVKLEP